MSRAVGTSRREDAGAGDVSSGVSRGEWGRPLACAVVLLGILALLFGTFFRMQYLFAIGFAADWGHTLVVPFIAGYFVYLNREKLLAEPFRTAWLGLVPMALGVALYLASVMGPRAMHHFNIMGFGVWMTIAGTVLLFFGWRAMRWLWFPLVYLLVFGQTISAVLMNIVTYKLQDITARGAFYVMSLALDVERQGNTLFILDEGIRKPLNIAEACSGMRMLVAFLALAVAMAYTGLPRYWQRAALVLAAVPNAIAVNILRVVTLGFLTLIDAELAAGDFHSFIGLVWLVPAFLIFLGIMWVIKHLIIEERPAPSKSASPPASASGGSPLRLRWSKSTPAAFVAACCLLLASGVGFRSAVHALNIYLKKEAVPLRDLLNNIPQTLGPWQKVGTDRVFDDTVVEVLGSDMYLDRAYAINGDPSKGMLSLHVVYYTGMIDMVPHVPARCFVAGGLEAVSLDETYPLHVDTSTWETDDVVNLATEQPYRVVRLRDDFTGERKVRMPVGDLTLRVTEFEPQNEPGVRVFGGYVFIANGRVASNAESVRLMAFNLKEKHAYYCKVQFVYWGRDATLEQYLSLVSDFMGHLLPELMQRLPDWSEIERLDQSDQAEPTL